MFLNIPFFRKQYETVPRSADLVRALWRLQKIILSDLEFDKVVQRICDGLLEELGYLNLGYKIIVLTLADEKKHVLKRISLSQTREARNAQMVSAIPFHEIDIPFSADDNYLIKTYKSAEPTHTCHWPDIFRPILTDEQALANQRAAGIKTSMLFPVIVKDKPIGVMIFSMIKKQQDVKKEEEELIRGFTDIVGVAVENAKLYQDLQDVTLKLRRTNAHLREINKQKDEFVSIASHELRTPMTSIKGYLWMALHKNKTPLDDATRHQIEVSYNSAERLINMVGDMLTISRMERKILDLKIEKFSLYELLRSLYDELKIQADTKHIEFLLEKEGENFDIQGDKTKVREVFQNIVGNSLKFTLNGYVKVHISQSENWVMVRVQDTGPGIQKEDMNKIFEKFAKIDHAYKKQSDIQGTGLGLYITKKIITLHGGKIRVESEVDKGATFIVHLPYHYTGDLGA